MIPKVAYNLPILIFSNNTSSKADIALSTFTLMGGNKLTEYNRKLHSASQVPSYLLHYSCLICTNKLNTYNKLLVIRKRGKIIIIYFITCSYYHVYVNIKGYIFKNPQVYFKHSSNLSMHKILHEELPVHMFSGS